MKKETVPKPKYGALVKSMRRGNGVDSPVGRSLTTEVRLHLDLICDSPAEAIVTAVTAFTQMFPNHLPTQVALIHSTN